MSKELIFKVTAENIAIALLEDKRLVELTNERSDVKFSVGDIYLGKVKKIMPGLNAAFVDLGYGRDAFLHYLDLGPQFLSLQKYLDYVISRKGKYTSFQRFKGKQDIDKKGKITNVLKEGQSILVQITKEPISKKGPRLSSEITIAGRNIVLIPFSDKISVSQKIESSSERNRLRKLLQSIKPPNYGVIVRTAAENKKVAVLDTELRKLLSKWETAFNQLKNNNPPKLFLQEIDRTTAIVRDMLNVSINHIYIDDETVYQEIKEYINTIAPENKKILKLYPGKECIFTHFGIDKQIKSLFGRTVSFKNGAYLIIEHTEAMHVIDVNSGNKSKPGNDQETNALEVNMAAAEEIARQLRLRDIGGIIVVDFIDMQKLEHKNMVSNRMRELMAEDRTKNSVLALSKFNVMEITRQRVRPELNIKTTEKCPTCKGKGEITASILFVDELENIIKYVLKNEPGIKYLSLKVHPFVEAYINKGFRSIRRNWKKKFSCKIKVTEEQSYSFLEYRLFNKNGEDIEQ